MPRRAVLDIETVGFPFDSLEPAIRESLLKNASTPEEEEEARNSLGLYPVTGFVTAIGLLDPDTGQGAMYYQSPGAEPSLPLEEDGVVYATGSEAEILSMFWKYVKGVKSLITFNGRGFDCPYLLVRSAVHRIQPTMELMPNRYSDQHIDLFERLSHFGSVRRRFGLDVWCRSLGITSPKQEGISGADVAGLHAGGRHLDIARYCVRDIRSTAELFRLWEKYFRFS